MSNVKALDITGTMPFNTYEHERLNGLIGQCNAPAMGTRFSWIRVPNMVENERGGLTAMYSFSLKGVEAVSWSWIDEFKAAVIEAGGEIDFDLTRDLEA